MANENQRRRVRRAEGVAAPSARPPVFCRAIYLDFTTLRRGIRFHTNRETRFDAARTT